MSNDIELEDLASKRRSSDGANARAVDGNTVGQHGAIGLWAWTSAAL